MKRDDPRRRYREHHEASRARHAAWAERGYQYPPPESVPLPADLRNLRCGATTRKGTPCKRRDVHLSGRCKFHGGASTGPRTDEGKARARANLALRWAHRRVDAEG